MLYEIKKYSNYSKRVQRAKRAKETEIRKKMREESNRSEIQIEKKNIARGRT